MFSPTRYIAWVRQFYGKVPYDLATSGMPLVPWQDVSVEPIAVDDLGAYPKLREAIATYNTVTPEEVVPALGTTQAIFLAYASLLSPGDDILVEHPGYEPLTRTAEGLGANVRTFERRREDGFRVDPDRVAAAITPKTRAIVVTSLHNPTGVRVTHDEVRALAAIAEARGAYVIVDEVYAPFDGLAVDGVFRGSARLVAPNVITLSSLTKCYGLGMHRIGWVLAPKEIVERAEAAGISTFGHLPLSHASYALSAFQAIGRLSERAQKLLAGKRALASDWVKTLPDAHWSAPADGLFGLVTLPGRGDLRERIEKLATGDRGVLVGAGTFFGAPESFRLSWASCDPKQFSEGLELLASIAS